MNVETGAEAAQFPEKEYINGIAVAVYKVEDRRSGAEMHRFPKKSSVENLADYPLRRYTIDSVPKELYVTKRTDL
jgi:hypothetical protein